VKGRKPASRFKSIVETVMPDRPGIDDNIALKTKRHIAFKVDRQVSNEAAIERMDVLLLCEICIISGYYYYYCLIAIFASRFLYHSFVWCGVVWCGVV
jgi:hypothetical protein